MGDVYEVLLTTDISTNQHSASIWDYNSGTCLHYYKKGGTIKPNSFSFIRDDYFIAGDKDKPLIHAWPINGQETSKNSKIVVSGKVSSLNVSQDGNWCAAGIGEQLNIWNIPSKKLVSVVAKHFQPITKVLFTSDTSYIVTSGEDGLILVWPLNRLVAQTDQTEPLHILSDHTLPVLNIILSKLSSGSTRIYSISTDCTMKIHELISGRLLLSVVFDKQPTALTADTLEKLVFIGITDGGIHEVNLMNPPRNIVYHEKSTNRLKGHEKSITTLSVSTDGFTLASGGEDGVVILWHILSKQKLRTIQLNGPISNVMFMNASKNIFSHDFRPSFILTMLERNVSELTDSNSYIEVRHRVPIELPYDDESYEENIRVKKDEDKLEEPNKLHSELEKLKNINSQLYQFALEHVLSQSNDKSLVGMNKKRKIK